MLDGMFRAGIKLGPSDWKVRLEESEAKFAEIWYRVDRAPEYLELFKVLKALNVSFGLHFWAVTKSGHEANIAYPSPEREESIDLIKLCLDVASEIKASYVNIHTGNRGLSKIDFEKRELVFDKHFPIISNEESVALRNSALLELGDYAKSVNVRLLVESIPAKTANGDWADRSTRLKPIDAFPTGLEGLIDLCERGIIGFTNDFCHQFSMHYDKEREVLWDLFYKETLALAPYTYLVHANTLTPPYNGTDEHAGILGEDFGVEGVFPTKSEFLELLLMLSRNGHDVWVVGEPKEEHVRNYKETLRLLSSL